MSARCLSGLRWLVFASVVLLFGAAYLKVMLSPVQAIPTRLLVEPSERRFAPWHRGWPAVFDRKDEFVWGAVSPDWKRNYWALAVDVVVGVGLAILLALLLRRGLWRPNPWRFSLRALLLFATFVALMCGWWFYHVHTRQDEEKGIATLAASRLQFYVEREYAGPGWLQRLYSPMLPVTRAIATETTSDPLSNSLKSGRGSKRSARRTISRVRPEEPLDMFWRVLVIRIQGPVADAQGLDLAAALCKFTQLRRIAIEKLPGHLSIEVLKPLSNCKSLEQLKLSATDVLPVGIAALGPLPNLRVLDLNMASHIDDGAVEAICKMPALEIVLLTGTQLTDAGARRLLALPSLRRVSLPFRISDKVVAEFVQRGVAVE